MSMPDQNTPCIDTLTTKDIPEILTLVEALKWTHVSADLEVMMRIGLFLGLRSDRGELIATGALFPYGETLASIGMIMVRPDHRRQGYAQAIMAALHASDRAQGRCLCLIATEEGEPLYRKIGYQTASRIRKFFADPHLVREKVQSLSGERSQSSSRKKLFLDIPPDLSQELFLPNVKLRKATKKDLPTLIQLDAASVGAARADLLTLRFAQSDVGVVAENDQGEIEAFALSCPQRDQRHIGPITASNRDVALAMILALVEGEKLEIRIDVPEEQVVLHDMLPGLGFRLIANPPAMVRWPAKLSQQELSQEGSDPFSGHHPSHHPGNRKDYWAITSQAFG